MHLETAFNSTRYIRNNWDIVAKRFEFFFTFNSTRYIRNFERYSFEEYPYVYAFNSTRYIRNQLLMSR